MGKVNVGRVIMGGLVAGVVVNAGEILLNAVLLKDDWAAVNAKLGLPAEPTGSQMAVFTLLGFILGMFMVWLYAAIRPRYGAGPRTAVTAGIAVWFTAYFLAMAFPVAAGMFPAGLVAKALVFGFVEATLAAVAGCYFYKEDSIEMPRASAAGAR
jgi:hypothetical protein